MIWLGLSSRSAHCLQNGAEILLTINKQNVIKPKQGNTNLFQHSLMKTALSQIQAPIGYRCNFIRMPQEEMLVKLMSGNIPVMKHLKKRPAEC